MVFAKRLRGGVCRGGYHLQHTDLDASPREGGGRYRMGEGEIEVDSIESIGFPDITPQLAREFGLLGVLDLLKVAKHGKGDNIYLIRFHYLPPARQKPTPKIRK